MPHTYVYFIQNKLGGPIKIGMTQNLYKRLRALRSEHGQDLIMLAWCDGGPATERNVHTALAAYRLHGEWFEPNEKLDALIAHANLHRRIGWHILFENYRGIAS